MSTYCEACDEEIVEAKQSAKKSGKSAKAEKPSLSSVSCVTCGISFHYACIQGLDTVLDSMADEGPDGVVPALQKKGEQGSESETSEEDFEWKCYRCRTHRAKLPDSVYHGRFWWRCLYQLQRRNPSCFTLPEFVQRGDESESEEEAPQGCGHVCSACAERRPWLLAEDEQQDSQRPPQQPKQPEPKQPQQAAEQTRQEQEQPRDRVQTARKSSRDKVQQAEKADKASTAEKAGTVGKEPDQQQQQQQAGWPASPNPASKNQASHSPSLSSSSPPSSPLTYSTQPNSSPSPSRSSTSPSSSASPRWSSSSASTPTPPVPSPSFHTSLSTPSSHSSLSTPTRASASASTTSSSFSSPTSSSSSPLPFLDPFTTPSQSAAGRADHHAAASSAPPAKRARHSSRPGTSATHGKSAVPSLTLSPGFSRAQCVTLHRALGRWLDLAGVVTDETEETVDGPAGEARRNVQAALAAVLEDLAPAAAAATDQLPAGGTPHLDLHAPVSPPALNFPYRASHLGPAVPFKPAHPATYSAPLPPYGLFSPAPGGAPLSSFLHTPPPVPPPPPATAGPSGPTSAVPGGPGKLMGLQLSGLGQGGPVGLGPVGSAMNIDHIEAGRRARPANSQTTGEFLSWLTGGAKTNIAK